MDLSDVIMHKQTLYEIYSLIDSWMDYYCDKKKSCRSNMSDLFHVDLLCLCHQFYYGPVSLNCRWKFHAIANIFMALCTHVIFVFHRKKKCI